MNSISNKITLLMMASKPDLMMQAVAAVTRTFPIYHEFLIAPAPELAEKDLEQLRAIPRVRFVPGTSDKDKAGEVRYGMLDLAAGDWIVNVDDDDLWYYQPTDLSALPPEIGLVSGSCQFVRFDRDPRSRGAVLLKRARPIKVPAESSALGGSFWAVRKKAWDSVSAKISREWWYSDWRMAYYIVHHGWRHHYVQQILGLVRSFGSVYPTGPEWEWPRYCAALEEKLRADKIEPGIFSGKGPTDGSST